MASITLRQAHSLKKDEARQRVNQIFESYKDKYHATSHWEGDTLHLTAPNFEATAEVKSASVDVNVSLSFTASLVKPVIESGLKLELDKQFHA